MSADVHVWERADLGGWRKAWSCCVTGCQALRHPMACFNDDAEIVCVCGLDNDRRPVVR